jgi:predicted permease
MAFTPAERGRYGSHYISAIARPKPGISLEGVRADLDVVSRRLAAARPDENNIGWEALVSPLDEYLVRNVERSLVVLLGAVSLVLLISCVNVANLLLACGAARQKELGVRAAIGASRRQLVRQLLVEQTLLAAASAAAGVLVAAWLLRAMLALLPNTLPRQGDIRLDAPVLGFALVLAAVTPLVFGLLPVLQISKPDLRDLLAVGGRQGGSTPAQRLRRVLVIAEVALAMVLLVGAGLLVRSFNNLAEVSPGFTPGQAIVAGVSLPEDRYPVGVRRVQFFRELLARIQRIPRVPAAGLTQNVPMVNDYVASLEI